LNDGRLIIISKNNADECAGLFWRVFKAPPFNYTWLTERKARRYIGDLLKTPGFAGFMHRADGRYTGACLGVVNDYFAAVTYEIKEIFVEPGIQRKGVGTALLAAVEKVLAARGVEAVTLFTQKGIPAYNFYVKHGYIHSHETAFFCKTLKG
jgi:GNAT superfamily N-acetyltransferase